MRNGSEFESSDTSHNGILNGADSIADLFRRLLNPNLYCGIAGSAANVAVFAYHRARA
jgi:hypothetical protein